MLFKCKILLTENNNRNLSDLKHKLFINRYDIASIIDHEQDIKYSIENFGSIPYDVTILNYMDKPSLNSIVYIKSINSLGYVLTVTDDDYTIKKEDGGIIIIQKHLEVYPIVTTDKKEYIDFIHNNIKLISVIKITPDIICKIRDEYSTNNELIFNISISKKFTEEWQKLYHKPNLNDELLCSLFKEDKLTLHTFVEAEKKNTTISDLVKEMCSTDSSMLNELDFNLSYDNKKIFFSTLDWLNTKKGKELLTKINELC